MNTQPRKKYKRTKVTYEHPNPLFEQWLREWKIEAENRGSNMKYNFQRAIKSLAKFPLPLKTGEECRVLANFGDKICKMLDKKLDEYIAQHGPIDWDTHIKMVSVTKKLNKANNSKRNLAKSILQTDNVTSLDDKQAKSNPGNKHVKTPNKSARSQNGYIPAYRSGAYGILIALYEASLSSNYPGYMKKSELMDNAQNHSDSSFHHAAEGSHYTAWSSMTTLSRKGLVTKEGNPAKYSLTDTGIELAIKIADKTDPVTTTRFSPIQINTLLNNREEASPISTSPKQLLNVSEIITLDDDSDEENVCPTSEIQSIDIEFSYIDDQGIETALRSKAEQLKDYDDFVGYLVKCGLTALLRTDLDYRFSDKIAPLGFTYAYIADAHAPEYSSGCKPKGRALVSSPVLKKIKSSENVKPRTFPVEKASAEIGFQSQLSSSNLNLKSPLNSQEIASSSTTVSSQTSEDCVSLNYEDLIQVSEFTLQAHSYDVVLCVDNAEVSGGFSGGKNNTKDIIISELNKRGINYNIRKLHVGDFLWICREKPTMTSSTKSKELVLPFIIERKRMDDLASSIKDGRYREQKFRLKNTGLSNLIYLVESYGKQHMSLPESTCEQAIMNTQIIDKFHVHRTPDQSRSADYLTVMTRFIQSKYNGRTFHSISRENFNKIQSSNSPETYDCFLQNFEEFNAAAVKNKQLSIQDMFAKHLLQLSGLSADKARPIVDKYPTVTALMEAYKRCNSDEERQQMLSNLKCTDGKRKVGSAISINIFKLYNQTRLL